MARKPKEQNEQPEATPYESRANFSPVEVIDTSAEMVNPSPINPSAVDRDGGRVVHVAAPPKFRVMAPQYIMSKGGRTLLRAGKIVDEHNFDLHALVSQGVQLEEVVVEAVA